LSSLAISITEKRFQSAHAEDLLVLDNLDFTLGQNTFTCIVGPSGCGKTTTLRIVLGLDGQYTGNVSGLNTGRAAAVFQEPRLIPWRTVRDNVDLCVQAAEESTRKLSNTAPENSNFGDSLENLYIETGLDELLDFYPSELSLGLARRVSLVRAFAIKPALLVLDEPFVSLDEATTARLRQLLLMVWRGRPTTVLMVTHNLQEAAELADRIVVLSQRPATVLETIVIDTPQADRTPELVSSVVQQVNDAQSAGSLSL